MSQARVDQIKWLEAEADKHQAEADRLRWEAAKLYAEEVANGKTYRELAADVGKSLAHVSYMLKVWRTAHVHQGEQERSFDAYYQDAKRGPELPRRSKNGAMEAAEAAGLGMTWDEPVNRPTVPRADDWPGEDDGEVIRPEDFKVGPEYQIPYSLDALMRGNLHSLVSAAEYLAEFATPELDAETKAAIERDFDKVEKKLAEIRHKIAA